MTNFFGRSRSNAPLESELRANRPEPSERLVDSIVSMVSRRPAARPARLRLAFAGGLTVALVALAGATGGLSYAATAVVHAAKAVADVSTPKPQAAPTAPKVTSACSQYAEKPIITSISPRYGMPGDTVTIYGSHFAAPSQVVGVRFSGGANAAFTVVSDSQIDATVPSGAQTGPITVWNCKGSASSGTYTVYYKSPCVVPNVVGETLNQAKADIRAAHCNVGHVKKTPPYKPHGTTYYVTRQQPAPGKVRTHGFGVNLWVTAS